MSASRSYYLAALSGMFAALAGILTGSAAAQDSVGTEAPGAQDALTTIIQRISTLNFAKLSSVLDKMGVQPSPEFYNCLCPTGDGYHYSPGPTGPCRRVGPLGGISWTSFRSGVEPWKSCGQSFPPPGYASLGEAMIDGVLGGRGSKSADGGTASPSEQDARAASGFLYDPWPDLFEDVSPDNILYMLGPIGRQILLGPLNEQMIAKALQYMSEATGGASDVVPEFIEWATTIDGAVVTSGDFDARVDLEIIEVAFDYDENKKPVVTEFVFKYPVLGDIKIDFGLGIDHHRNPDGSNVFRPSGKMRFGFAGEKTVGKGQIEAKYGIEIDPSKVGITSLDDEPEPENASDAKRFVSGMEKYLAAVDMYFGGGASAGPSIGDHQIGGGTEVTYSVKDIYSQFVFKDMHEALDNMLEHQREYEKRRHEHFREMARQLGVDPAGKTIGEVTKVIHRAITDEARRQGVQVEGRTIKQIRDELRKRAAAAK